MPDTAWPTVCQQFALRMLSMAEHLRPELDQLEAAEQDASTLERLYCVDHGITRLRRIAGNLQILAGGDDDELGGYRSSLVDVIREAESAIEHYTRVSIGRVAELGVVEYAAKDVAWLIAALIDNATSYSPATVIVSAHLLDNGGIMMRIEDSGIGIDPRRVENLNAVLAGPVPDVSEDIARHTGFPIIHRLARKHGIRVRLASRPGAGGGTIAMVLVPPELLCEMPQGFPAAAGQGRHREPSWPRNVTAAGVGNGEAHHPGGAHLSLIQRPGGARTAPPETALPRPELTPQLAARTGQSHRAPGPVRPVPPLGEPTGRPSSTSTVDRSLPAAVRAEGPADTEANDHLPRRESMSLRSSAPRPVGLHGDPGRQLSPDDELMEPVGGPAQRPVSRPAPPSTFAQDLDSFAAGLKAARERGNPPATSPTPDDPTATTATMPVVAAPPEVVEPEPEPLPVLVPLLDRAEKPQPAARPDRVPPLAAAAEPQSPAAAVPVDEPDSVPEGQPR